MRTLQIAALSLLVSQYITGHANESFSSSCVEEYSQGHLEKALYYCHGASSSPEAKLILGRIYSLDGMASSEMKKAYEYFAAAANQNLPDAQFMMALCYQNGFGVSKNTATALHWYNQARKNGFSGPELNPKWLRGNELVVIENWPGANELRMALDILHSKDKNIEKGSSLAWFNSAAEKGNIEAEYQLGRLYALGNTAPQDDGKAWFWFKKAADKNHQGAQSFLAWMSMLGLGVKENKEDAIAWFLLASQSKPHTEDTISKDIDDIFSQLPDENNFLVNRSPDSEYLQGIELLESRLNDQDVRDGITLLDKAADENYTPAQLYLAKLYHEGHLVEKDLSKAANLYRQAANNGDPDAQYSLGWMYFNGEGVPQSNDEAIIWFTLAAQTESRAKEALQFVNAQRAAIVLGDHKIATPTSFKIKLQRAGTYLKSFLPAKKSSS